MRRAVRESAGTFRRRLANTDPPDFRAALEAVAPEDRDAWVDRLCDIDELPDDAPLPRGCVPYWPCSVSTILEAVRDAEVTATDVFVDVGAGLGRPAIVTHLLTGAGCVGLEIQPELVAAARGRAAWLGLDRVGFVEGDAVELVSSMTVASVFFLYCPFSGARLEHLLDELEILARVREIRVCCVNMAPLNRSWLPAVSSTPGDVTVYRSEASGLRPLPSA